MRLIDADALLEILNKEKIPYDSDVNYFIMNAPTVEPKHGHWTKDRLVSTSGGTYEIQRCSNCEWYGQTIGWSFKYCPYCGAKMDEVKEHSVDAGEVVRCKDCVYWRKDINHCLDKDRHAKADDYCSWGERKDEVTK